MDLENSRREYEKGRLKEAQMPDLPEPLAEKWIDEAVNHPEIQEASIMTLATSGKRNKPTCRQVLLKGQDAKRYIWYSNYESRKGRQLQENPRAALLFFWEPLQRQLRIEGRVQRLSRDENKRYFDKRPLGSRIAASISPQSKRIEYEQLKARFDKTLQRVQSGQKETHCPKHWGGYALEAEWYEFWQGGAHRLHDRWVYELGEKGDWEHYRVGP